MASYNLFCDPATGQSLRSDGTGGGSGNCIDSTGAATTYGVIGGNCVFPGTNHASIFGGNGNKVSGSCSAILGGSGNSDGGFNNVFIAGSGITAVNGSCLYINGLNANLIPYFPSIAPPNGTVFAMPFNTAPSFALSPSGGVLWIM